MIIETSQTQLMIRIITLQSKSFFHLSTRSNHQLLWKQSTRPDQYFSNISVQTMRIYRYFSQFFQKEFSIFYIARQVSWLNLFEITTPSSQIDFLSSQPLKLSQTHNFRTSTPEHFGTGIYLVASLLNHSCSPNCTVVFQGRQLSIVATKDIPAGEEASEIIFLSIEFWEFLNFKSIFLLKRFWYKNFWLLISNLFKHSAF